jgi:hypothetical protein
MDFKTVPAVSLLRFCRFDSFCSFSTRVQVVYRSLKRWPVLELSVETLAKLSSSGQHCK